MGSRKRSVGVVSLFLLVALHTGSLTGQATPPLQPGSVLAVPSPRDVVVFDLDGDGAEELLVPGWPGNVVTLLRTDGNGALSVEFVFVPISPWDLAVGDVNGDGVADLVVSDRSDTLAILFGGGPAPFSIFDIVVTPVPVRGIALDDLDVDGDLDVVALCDFGVLVLPAEASPSPLSAPYAAALIYAMSSPELLGPRFEVADVDGDGAADLVIPRQTVPLPQGFPTGLDILRNDGNGGFAVPESVTGAFRGVALGDVDMDGSADIVESAFPSEIRSYLHLSAEIGSPVATTLAGGQAFCGPVDLADMNGDGSPDVVVLGPASANLTYSSIVIGVGAGNGSFGTTLLLTLAFDATGVRTGDFDGNGAQDVVVWNQSTNQLQVLLNGAGASLLRRGDVNSDGGVNVADAPVLLGFLFGSTALACLDASDVNDDANVTISDVVFLLDYLFVAGSAAPPAPGPAACGPDPTIDSLPACSAPCI